MGAEGRIHRNLAEGTILSAFEHTTPVFPKDIVPGTHFLYENGKTVLILEKEALGSDKTVLRLHALRDNVRTFPNDRKIQVYVAP